MSIKDPLDGKNGYTILGVASDADEKTLKAAYREISLTCHPDVNSSEEAQKRFVDASLAYNMLIDPAQRKAHDLSRGIGQQSGNKNTGRVSSGNYMSPNDFSSSSSQRRSDASGAYSSGGQPFYVRSGIHNDDIIYDGDIVVTGGVTNGDIKSSRGHITVTGGVVNGDIRAERGNVAVNGGVVNGDIKAPNGVVEKNGGITNGSIKDRNGERSGESHSDINFGDVSVGGGRVNMSGTSINGKKFDTDGSMSISNTNVSVSHASRIMMQKSTTRLEAKSLSGMRDMSMNNGIIRGGSVTINGVEVGRDTGQGVNVKADARSSSLF